MRRMYSKKQVQVLTKEYLETNDVVAKTIKQNQPNWEADITSFPNITGGTATPIYCRCQQLNQSLHIIMIGKIENTTESAISAYSTTQIDIVLPEEIASKIYDVLRNKASDSIESNVRIAYAYASATTVTASDMSKYLNDICMCVLNRTPAKTISLSFQRNSNITIQAGDTMYFESRIELDLI